MFVMTEQVGHFRIHHGCQEDTEIVKNPAIFFIYIVITDRYQQNSFPPANNCTGFLFILCLHLFKV